MPRRAPLATTPVLLTRSESSAGGSFLPPNTLTPGYDEENRFKPAEVLAAEESVQTLTPEQVADAVIASLRRRRGFLVVPGRDSRLAALAIRYAPAVVDRALRRPER